MRSDGYITQPVKNLSSPHFKNENQRSFISHEFLGVILNAYIAAENERILKKSPPTILKWIKTGIKSDPRRSF